jgi:phosphoribosylformylglycinamidine (FGAM) synthase PurS component
MMEVEITVTIRDEGKTVESFSGIAVYDGWKNRKVNINSSSLGTEEKDKKNVKEIVGEVCDKALFKTMSLR